MFFITKKQVFIKNIQLNETKILVIADFNPLKVCLETMMLWRDVKLSFIQSVYIKIVKGC